MSISPRVKTLYQLNTATGAHGLGNTTENKLPLCQVISIQEQVDNLQSADRSDRSPIFWWCDTLCIPLGAQNDAYRRKAIESMRWTYYKAAHTLILDAELLRSSVHANPMELYVRLKLSSWARRLWTFQEANLSRNAIVQLSDGVKSLRTIYKAVKEREISNQRALFTRYSGIADAMFPPLLFAKENEDLPQPNFLAIWTQLEWRATSRQSDEAVGLATLMRIDSDKILEISKYDLSGRMVRFFEYMCIIPLRIVFQPPPRIPRRGFQWAPMSFLTCFRNNSPLTWSRKVHGLGFVDTAQQGLVLYDNYSIEFDVCPETMASWGVPCLDFTVRGTRYDGAFRTSYAYFSDWESARGTAIRRLGAPALIALLPAARDGTVACILVETKEVRRQGLLPLRIGEFVGIVTIARLGSLSRPLVRGMELLPTPWLIQ